MRSRQTESDKEGREDGEDRHDTCIYGSNKMSYVAFGFLFPSFGSSRK